MPKKTLLTALAVVIILPALAPANGFNLNGLGSRAQAMGGAFVGIANDFSAVFWNPAGAAGFRKEMFGFCAMDLIPAATYHLEPFLDMGVPLAKTKTSHYLGGLAAYYKPISSKVIVGLGIGTPSGLGTMWDGADFTPLTDGTVYDWSSKVGVISISPLVAVKLNDMVSVGATVNVNYGMFSLKMPAGTVTEGNDLGQYEENMNGWGIGATFGVLVTPSAKLGFGLTVRTPSTVSFKGTAIMPTLPVYELPGSSDLKRKIMWPLWIAGGVSFRPVPRLLLSADVHWTQWSKLNRITTDYLEPAWQTLVEMSGLDVRVLDWKNTTQLRFGAEYTLNASTALRAGYYRDPAPGPVTTLNVLLPSHTFNAVSLGIGKTISDLQLDFGLEYLMGNTRTWMDTTMLPRVGMPGTYGMKIVVPTVSVNYKF
ncbi:MAG: outer membrane protein transport protein [Candidatus Aminicenantes bacterium]|nr:outer membrane protein transport protein [Candidatus Aminicenantes bacterium]